MSSISDISISNVLIPENVLKHVNNEKIMTALAKLIISIVEKSLAALAKNEFLEFDANTAAFDCERLALCLYSIASSNSVKEEAKKLLEKIDDIKTKILNREKQQSNGVSKPEEFFSSEINSIKVSNKIAYLLQAHTLTCTKTIANDGSFKTDKNKLSAFTIDITEEDKKSLKLCSNIVNFLQQELSKRSMNALKKKISKIITHDSKESLMKMFEEENIVKKRSGYYSRYFSCCYTNIKSFLLIAQEKQIPIMLKRWIRKENDQPLSIMLQSPSVDEPIQCMQDEESKKIGKIMPIIVFQASIPAKIDKEIIDEDYLRKKISDIGFYEMVLADVAKVVPFGSKSNLSMVKVEKIQKEMTEYKEKEKVLNGIFVLDHIYCSSLSIENKGN